MKIKSQIKDTAHGKEPRGSFQKSVTRNVALLFKAVLM